MVLNGIDHGNRLIHIKCNFIVCSSDIGVDYVAQILDSESVMGVLSHSVKNHNDRIDIDWSVSCENFEPKKPLFKVFLCKRLLKILEYGKIFESLNSLLSQSK